MAKNRINIELGVTGKDEAQTALDKTAQAVKGVGETTQDAGRKGSDGLGAFSDAAKSSQKNLDDILASTTAFLTKMASVAAAIEIITSLIDAQNKAIKEHGDLSVSQTESLTRLQFLGDFYKSNPNAREEVVAFSEYGRRPFEEVASAYYNLRSSAGNLSDEQQRSVMLQALEIGKMDRQAPLDELIGAMTLYSNKSGETNMDSMQNVMLRTVDKARSSYGQMAQYMPAFLSQGMAGGMSGPEAAGLWAFASNQLNSPAEATTALKGVFEGLQGNASPEAARLLKKLGVSQDMNFFQKIETLGSAGLTYQQAGTLAGTYSGFLLDMIRDPKAMMDTVGVVREAGADQRDLAREALDSLYGTDERARLTDEIRYYEVVKANAAGGDIDSLRFKRNDAAKAAAMVRTGADLTFTGQIFDKATDAVNFATRPFGYDIFDPSWGRTNITINNAPTTIYARPGGDPTPRISPADVGAE